MDLRRERLIDARRTGLLERLTHNKRLPRKRAEQLVAEWEAEAARRGLDPLSAEYRHQGDVWLGGRLREA